MNHTISPLNIKQPGNHITDATSSVSAGYHRGNEEKPGRSSSAENSFHDTIRRAYEDTGREPESKEAEGRGKSLPPSDNSADAAAENDRMGSSGDHEDEDDIQDHQAENPADNPSTQNPPITALSLATAEPASADGKTGTAAQPAGTQKQALSTQGMQRLTGETETTADLAAGQRLQRLKQDTNTSAATSGSEKLTGQKPDATALNPDQLEAELISPSVAKAQALKTAIQQQINGSNQAVASSPVLSELIESGSPGLSVAPGSLLNNQSATNLQVLPQLDIAEAFSRPAWSQGLGKQIVWMVNQNISSAELRLNPAHLGPIEVLVDLKDDQISIAMSSRHAVVREAMEQAMPKLREMLDANGFNLAESDISQHSFSRQHERNTEQGQFSKIASQSEQGVISDINDMSIRHPASSISMVDYYI